MLPMFIIIRLLPSYSLYAITMFVYDDFSFSSFDRQALCEIYDRPAEIWAYDAVAGAKKLRTFHDAVITGRNNPPMDILHGNKKILPNVYIHLQGNNYTLL
jgi:hypothetical protein